MHRKNFFRPVCPYVLAAIPLLAAPMLHAQDTTAKVLGQVSDASGALIPNASVTVTNVATGVVVTKQSDSQGTYEFLQLPIGSYTVSARMQGFTDETSPPYKLEINKTQRVDFKLPVAGQSQSVEVSINASAIDTVNTTVGGSVTERPLVDLPLNGRNILDLAQLQPGVTLANNPGNISAGSVSIAGGRTDSVTYLLDGGNNSSLLNNGVVFNPNPDACREGPLLTWLSEVLAIAYEFACGLHSRRHFSWCRFPTTACHPERSEGSCIRRISQCCTPLLTSI